MNCLNRFPVLAFAALLVASTPVTGQSRRTTPPIDPVAADLDRARASYPDSATRRLEVLAEVWGDLALHHPVPSASRLRWDEVLVEAISGLDAVRTEAEFAHLLNRVVFAPLRDPLRYATTIAENAARPNYLPALTTRRLTSGTLYVSASDRHFVGPFAESDQTRWHEFARQLRAVIDSAATQAAVTRLVVDLRSQSYVLYRPGHGAPWLSMWLRDPMPMGQEISVFRGSRNDRRDVMWLLSPRATLRPFGAPVPLPTVFLANRTSYAAAEQALDAVRSARRDVAVVFEESGPIPSLDFGPFRVWYPDSILLPHNRAPLLSADGALGSVVDLMLAQPTDLDELAAVAERALAARSAQPPREAFAFDDARITDDSILPGPLTRAQRVAGLLKTWYWVRHFHGYLDDAAVDWRQLVSDWLPRVAAASDDADWYAMLQQISASLNDSHSRVQHPSLVRGNFTVPLQLLYAQGRVAVARVDTTEADIGIAPGDEVLAVDGRAVRDIEADVRLRRSHSQPSVHIRPWIFALGDRDSPARLRVRTASGVRDFTLPRSRTNRSVYGVTFSRRGAVAILPGNVGYLSVAHMTSLQLFDSAMTALSGTRGLILDGRGINSYFGDVEIARLVTGVRPWRLLTGVSYQHAGYGRVRALGESSGWRVPELHRETAAYTGPIVLLSSNEAASSGETLAMTLREYRRATIVGEATDGTYGGEQRIILPGGASFSFTASRALFEDGGKYHGVGVVPDIPAGYTIAGLRARRDEVLEAGIAALRAAIETSRSRR